MNRNSNNNQNQGPPAIHSGRGYSWFWSYMLTTRNIPPDGTYDRDSSEFLMFCFRHHPESRAQIFQDLYVMYKLKHKQNGFFVEFGATDGVSINNTVLLEKRFGWSGILAEPFPIWHERLKANRNCSVDFRCVWSETGKTIEFLATNSDPEYATINSFKDSDVHKDRRLNNSEVISVETVSLNDLLEENNAPHYFDYLSIDTEGSEFDILNSLDFDKYSPRIITVEHNTNEVQRGKIKALLESKGYIREFEVFSMFDDWYYHRDLK